MLFLIFLLIPLVSADFNDHLCPKGWKEGPNICYRLTEKKVRFREAIVECLTLDRHVVGPTLNLIRVGQLRKLNNITRISKAKSKKVRIDAYLNLDNTWVDYLNRFPVSFGSFPTPAGLPGQTLLYNLETKTLEAAYTKDDNHYGLCVRTKKFTNLNDACYQTGVQVECSDRGDCRNNVCVCDSGFSGTQCQTGASGRILEEAMDPKMGTDCQEFVRDDGSITCYTIATEGTSYQEAIAACSSRGLKLAEVLGPKDQENLKSIALPFKSAWIPLTDMDANKEYQWESGAKLEFTNWATPIQNRELSMHPCVVMDAINDHQWSDVSCEGSPNFIGVCAVY